MSYTATIVFGAAGLAVLVGTEIVRTVIHRGRERTRGISGTQDIAMWGTVLAAILFLCCGLNIIVEIWNKH
jgi:hypothetical protein